MATRALTLHHVLAATSNCRLAICCNASGHSIVHWYNACSTEESTLPRKTMQGSLDCLNTRVFLYFRTLITAVSGHLRSRNGSYVECYSVALEIWYATKPKGSDRSESHAYSLIFLGTPESPQLISPAPESPY